MSGAAMWADNETDVDLLGFDFLVDTLLVALTEPRLLPLTAGLLGDWGSGKSSLLRITRKELTKAPESEGEPSPRYICVDFSPWQHEDYGDVKVALMTAVLDAVVAHVGDDHQEQVSQLRGFLRGLGRLGRKGGRVAIAAGQTAAPILLLAADPSMDPALVDVAKAGVNVAAAEANKMLEDPKLKPSGTPARDDIIGVGRFRAEFAKLVNALDGVNAVVVFIDDLDRCLPETVVNTFEAIRLFLNTPKTAYVLAANPAVVEAAIDSRYPQQRRPDGTGIGADYLEKMLQLKVAIPPLAVPESETYINLLLAELRLNADQFDTVLQAARGHRAAGTLQVAFNFGVAAEALGEVPPDLAADLNWAASISEVLGAGLRGNPRQLKRFLNNLMLKHRSAQRRQITLELPVLAKLMVLEEQHLTDFQRLFDWQLTAAGPIAELAAAESTLGSAGSSAEPDTTAAEPTVAGEGERASDAGQDGADQPESSISEDVQTWAEKSHIQKWLRLDPRLGGTDLRPYFTYSRDKLTFGVAVTRLAPHLQVMLSKLQSEAEALRRRACAEAAELPEGERAQLVDALLGAVLRNTAGVGLLAAIELAERAPDTLPVVCAALMKVPSHAVGAGRAAQAVQRLPSDNAAVVELLDRWENSGAAGLKAVIATARESKRRGGRG
jgi:KAP family P-loop domain